MAHWITDAQGRRFKIAGNYYLKEKEAFLMAHPIGSYYISENSTSPAELYGGGWEKVEGRVLLGASDSYPVGSTGGSATHNHSLGSGSAAIGYSWDGSNNVIFWQQYDPIQFTSYYYSSGQEGFGSGGKSGSSTRLLGTTDNTNNISPYRATNIWYRYQ